jgi:hypothetical protein
VSWEAPVEARSSKVRRLKACHGRTSFQGRGGRAPTFRATALEVGRMYVAPPAVPAPVPLDSQGAAARLLLEPFSSLVGVDVAPFDDSDARQETLRYAFAARLAASERAPSTKATPPIRPRIDSSVRGQRD